MQSQLAAFRESYVARDADRTEFGKLLEASNAKVLEAV